jgi:hypothetical protein
VNLFLLASAVLILLSLAGVVAAATFVYGLHLPKSGYKGRVTLILPISGACPYLPQLIANLNAQSLQPHRLIITVESPQDPAYLCAQKAMCNAKFSVDLVIAGLANKCAQKCWNQIAAIHQLDGHDDAIILMDGDIQPPQWWLSVLASPVLIDKADVVTGYRWHRTTRLAPAQHLIASIDRGIAMLPSLRCANLTWGGSLALSPSALAALNLPVLLSRVLSDDCTIGAQAAALGLRVLTRRLLRVPTPPHKDIASAWSFGRRQYQIIHIYRPGLWALALGTLSIRLLAWSVILTSLADKAPGTSLVLIALACLALTTVALQQQAAGRLGLRDDLPSCLGQIACALLKPLIDLFHWTLVVAAWRPKNLHWGHVNYQIHGQDCIQITDRISWTTLESNNDSYQ